MELTMFLPMLTHRPTYFVSRVSPRLRPTYISKRSVCSIYTVAVKYLFIVYTFYQAVKLTDTIFVLVIPVIPCAHHRLHFNMLANTGLVGYLLKS